MRYCVSILLVLLTSSPLTAQQNGYSIADSDPDQLFLVPLDGTAPVPVGVLSVEDILGLAFDSSGTLYGVSADTDSLVIVDPASAQVTSVGALGFDASVAGGVTFDPDGLLWLVSGNDAYTVDPASGQAELQGHIEAPVEVMGLTACSSQLTALYHGGGGEVGIATIDKETLALEIVNETFSYFAEPPAGVDWHDGEIFAIETRPYGIITPSPMSWGSFLARLSSSGVLLDNDWLMYTPSLAFAVGPPPPYCSSSAVEIPVLSIAGVLTLGALLAIGGVVALSRRRRGATRYDALELPSL